MLTSYHEKVVHGKHSQAEARVSEVAQQVKVLAMQTRQPP